MKKIKLCSSHHLESIVLINGEKTTIKIEGIEFEQPKGWLEFRERFQSCKNCRVEIDVNLGNNCECCAQENRRN